jgi:hypothetical protein
VVIGRGMGEGGMMQRRTFLALGLLALSATACSPSSLPGGENGEARGTAATGPAQPTVPPTPIKTYGLNELVSIKGWDLAIQKVERLGNRLAWSQFNPVLIANGTWFAVVVDLKNTSDAPATLALSDFTLRAAGATFTSPDVSQLNAYGQMHGAKPIGEPVPPGVSVSYYTIYDVPPDATNLQFIFLKGTQPVFAVGNATRAG